MQHFPLTRREFLGASAAAAGALLLPRQALARRPSMRPDKLRIVVVGTANQAAWNLSQIADQEIVALCDVDANFLAAAGANFPGAKHFRDFREMLSASLDFDAALVAAPDHIHAPAAAMALRLGKHVYCEKPLAHSVFEVRTLARLAAEKKLVTQMGTHIHSTANYRRVVELVRSDAIGKVRQVHTWCNKSWSGGKYSDPKPAPGHVDWNLWLGPAPQHDYCDGIHPGNWRKFWAYGTGTLGDMACHYMDLPHWALDLDHPTSVHAKGPEKVDAVGTPAWLVVEYEHPAKGDRPEVKLTWHDGDKRPDILSKFKNKDASPLAWGDGNLFIGDTGMILANYDTHLLLRDNVVVDITPPKPTIPDSIGHHKEWIEACRTGSPTTCNFKYSGALSEAVLLGNVSYRVGKKLQWDAANLKATNAPEAAEFITPKFRDGWKL